MTKIKISSHFNLKYTLRLVFEHETDEAFEFYTCLISSERIFRIFHFHILTSKSASVPTSFSAYVPYHKVYDVSVAIHGVSNYVEQRVTRFVFKNLM